MDPPACCLCGAGYAGLPDALQVLVNGHALTSASAAISACTSSVVMATAPGLPLGPED